MSSTIAEPRIRRRTATKRHSAIARGVALLSGLVLALTAVQVATPAEAAITDPQTIVSLTFDDSTAGQTQAADILNARDMDATFFAVSGFIGAPGYLTRDQLTGMASAGHEIGGHTVTHADLTAASPEEAKRQVCNDRSTFLSWGFPVTSFAYPFAAVNSTAEAIVRDCGYNSARGLGDIETAFGCVGCGFSEAIPPANPYYTRATDQFDNRWTLQNLQDAVVNAEERGGGGWLQFTFHGVCSDCPTETLSISPTLLSQFVDWLNPRSETENTIVRTVGQVIGGDVKPPVNVGAITPLAPGPGVNGLANASP